MYRILIVEDDEIIARSLKKHLESWDYDVVCVEDFSDIMKEFAGAAPQLVLMENKEKIVSRDTLMTKLWESDSFVDENTLSVNVGRLRKKLDAAGLPDFILTKKGIGYHIG